MSPRQAKTDELWRGYRRPVRRDRALWVALVVVVIVVVVEYALSSPTTPLGWVAFGLIAVALAVLIVSLVGVAVGVFRGFADGWRSNRSDKSRRAAADASSPTPTGSAPADQAASGPSPTDGRGQTGATPATGYDVEPTPASAAADSGPTLPRPAVPDAVKDLAATAKAKATASASRSARTSPRA